MDDSLRTSSSADDPFPTRRSPRCISSSQIDDLAQGVSVVLITLYQLALARPRCICSFDTLYQLHRMEKLSADVPKKKVLKEADALRSYIYARRHFGSGELN